MELAPNCAAARPIAGAASRYSFGFGFHRDICIGIIGA
jgi:hypothetical protein